MTSSYKPQRHLDELDIKKHGRFVEVVEPTIEIITELLAKFTAEVDGAASKTTVLSIFHHNPETMLIFRNKKSKEVGFISYLPLNESGHHAFANGEFSTVEPKVEFIAKNNESPKSCYVWAIGITAKTSGGISFLSEILSEPRFQTAPIYCRAANEKAHKLFLSLGFHDGATIDGNFHDDLMELKRLKQVPEKKTSSVRKKYDGKNPPLYDTYNPQTATATTVGIKLVHTSEELAQAFMIRAATYIGEQAVPWSEDMDGNDYCAAHLIGYMGREPAACVRVRFFNGFVKLERLAVLPHFRKSTIALRMVRAAIDYAKAKGYSRFYGHAERSVVPIWRHFGFVPRPDTEMSYMTEREYVEGDMITEPSDNPLTPSSDGYVLIRPEGQWHREGVLESAPKQISVS